MSVKEKLDYISSNEKEPVLFPILKQLFLKIGFDIALITHGVDEYGKDLVLMRYDSTLSEENWISVVVKNRKASNKDFEDGGEIKRQIKTSFDHPYIHDSKRKFINKVIVVINGSVSTQAKTILLESMHGSKYSNVQIWNKDRLSQEIEKHVKTEFLGEYNFLNNKFILEQRVSLSNIDDSKKLFNNLKIENIESLFVDVKTSYTEIRNKEKQYKYDKNKRDTRIIDDSEEILNSNKDCLIHGIPTSGKTVLLKRIGLQAMKNADKLNAPFYFDFSKTHSKEIFNVNKYIQDQFNTLTGGDLDKSKFYKVILLIDGIDDLKETQIKDLSNSIITFKKQEEKEGRTTQIIFASRKSDILDFVSDELQFEKIELFPFNIGQAMKLVKKLIPKEIGKSNQLIKALRTKQLSGSLIRTPLAITLLCILYRDDEVDLKEIPANITELYNKFTDFYLNRWDSSKGISLQYKFEELKNILGFIAAYLQRNNMNYISKSDLKVLLQNMKKDFDYEDLKDIPSFIDTLIGRVEIIVYDPNEDLFFFFNHSFQEYFASIFFDDSNEEELLDNFFNEMWEQSLVFYCGKQPKRNVFIDKISKQILPSDLGQKLKYLLSLSHCLQAANLVDRSTKRNIIERLIFQFDDFYKSLLSIESENEYGFSFVNNTVIFILQFRGLLRKLLYSKHINKEDTLAFIEKYLVDNPKNDLSIVTKYSLAHLGKILDDTPIYIEYFAEIKDKDPIWDRITYVDLKLSNIKELRNEKTINRLKRKQKRNRDYIISQFESPAIKHFSKSIEKAIDD